MSNPADTFVGDDNDYVNRSGQNNDGGSVPVVRDAASDEGVDRNADSDASLARDDNDAIDESNVIDQRTRGAAPDGGYREPGDDEGLPGPDDGTSAVAQDGTKN